MEITSCMKQQSPWGYVLDDEPVPFVVDGTQDVVTVTKYNTVQKGTITIHKEGEVFSHVAEAGGLYQPQYEVQGQPGAVYDITALEEYRHPGWRRSCKGRRTGGYPDHW